MIDEALVKTLGSIEASLDGNYSTGYRSPAFGHKLNELERHRALASFKDRTPFTIKNDYLD